MSIDEKACWNKKHTEHSHSSLAPDPLLVSAYDEFLSQRPVGDALDAAGGVGRHTVWLAERGWNVRLLDISDVGIAQARENVRRISRGSVTLQVQDLDGTQDLGREQYDLILVFFFLQRALFPALISALKAGGHLIYKTYTVDQQNFSGGPRDPSFLLRPNELLHAFAPLRVLHYHESAQGKGVAELVAQKS